MQSNVEAYIGLVPEPERLEGLSADRPDPDADFLIVGRYNKAPAGGRLRNPNGPWIWCSHCQKPTHWEGFVIKAPNDTYHLIGGDCGKLHYGTKRFGAAHGKYLAHEKRKKLLSDLGKIQAVVGEVLSELTALKRSNALVQLRNTRKQFEKACPDAAFRLRSAALAGGLSTHQRVRTSGGKYELMPVSLGQLEGVFVVSDDADGVIQKAEIAISEIAEVDIEHTDTKDLAKLKQGLGRSLSELVRVKLELEKANVFFSKRNLDRLEQWSLPFNRFFRLTAKQDRLEIWDYKKGSTVVKALPRLTAPPIDIASSFAI